eukprot:scaffold5131_cov93-Isochrysis_galbana.AAC.1
MLASSRGDELCWWCECSRRWRSRSRCRMRSWMRDRRARSIGCTGSARLSARSEPVQGHRSSLRRRAEAQLPGERGTVGSVGEGRRIGQHPSAGGGEHSRAAAPAPVAAPTRALRGAGGAGDEGRDWRLDGRRHQATVPVAAALVQRVHPATLWAGHALARVPGCACFVEREDQLAELRLQPDLELGGEGEGDGVRLGRLLKLVAVELVGHTAGGLDAGHTAGRAEKVHSAVAHQRIHSEIGQEWSLFRGGSDEAGAARAQGAQPGVGYRWGGRGRRAGGGQGGDADRGWTGRRETAPKVECGVARGCRRRVRSGRQRVKEGPRPRSRGGATNRRQQRRPSVQTRTVELHRLRVRLLHPARGRGIRQPGTDGPTPAPETGRVGCEHEGRDFRGGGGGRGARGGGGAGLGQSIPCEEKAGGEREDTQPVTTSPHEEATELAAQGLTPAPATPQPPPPSNMHTRASNCAMRAAAAAAARAAAASASSRSRRRRAISASSSTSRPPAVRIPSAAPPAAGHDGNSRADGAHASSVDEGVSGGGGGCGAAPWPHAGYAAPLTPSPPAKVLHDMCGEPSTNRNPAG